MRHALNTLLAAAALAALLVPAMPAHAQGVGSPSTSTSGSTIAPYPIDNSGSPAGAVPLPGGSAATPPRPGGQGFQDRALNCIQAGASQGVGPGQMGAYTGGCVNQ
jgi:hypothetical protein